MAKEKVYLIRDTQYYSKTSRTLDSIGRLVKEDGTVIGSHHSSSDHWLRLDLNNSLGKEHDYEIVDLIGQEVPERFKLLNDKDV